MPIRSQTTGHNLNWFIYSFYFIPVNIRYFVVIIQECTTELQIQSIRRIKKRAQTFLSLVEHLEVLHDRSHAK